MEVLMLISDQGKFVSSYGDDVTCQNPNSPSDAYKSLRKIMHEVIGKPEKQLSTPISLYFQDQRDDARQEELVTKSLGNGGCKRAVQLSNGKALLIPNMDTDPINAIENYWPRIVDEEIKMSNFLQQIGVLGLQLQKVTVFSQKDSEYGIPAYLTDSFDSLKEKNIYVIDSKNSKSSTWKHKLFANLEDAKNPENWKSITSLLVEDIAKLAHYQFSLGGDSLNVAIVRNLSEDHIRYFGFDFTSKRYEISIPNVAKPSIYNEPNENIVKIMEKPLFYDIKRAFSGVINQVLFAEYEEKYFLPKEADDLQEKIVEMYSKDILEKVKNFQKT
jgi:hypothetical protein